MKNAIEDVVYSIDDNFFAQCSCQLNSFFHHVRSIEKSTMFYAFKVNISNKTKVIFKNVDLVELDVTLYIIYNFYNATLYELISAIVTRLKMNVFINKLNQ